MAKSKLKIPSSKGKNWPWLLVDNLQRNTFLDHLEFVRKGIYKPDKDYYRALKFEKHLETLEKFREWKYKLKRRGFAYPEKKMNKFQQ